MEMTVSAALTLLMVRENLSQAALAKRWQVSQPTISRWLRGSRRVRHRAARLALLDLGVNPRCL